MYAEHKPDGTRPECSTLDIIQWMYVEPPKLALELCDPHSTQITKDKEIPKGGSSSVYSADSQRGHFCGWCQSRCAVSA